MLQAATAPEASKAFYIDPQPSLEPSLAPAAIRTEIAKCVAANHIAEACVWLADGLRRFPDSEDLLVMQALLAEVQLDWAAADSALQKLLSVQGRHAPSASWLHWVRVLRCMQQPERAVEAVQMALKHHPHDEALRAEALSLGANTPEQDRNAA